MKNKRINSRYIFVTGLLMCMSIACGCGKDDKGVNPADPAQIKVEGLDGNVSTDDSVSPVDIPVEVTGGGETAEIPVVSGDFQMNGQQQMGTGQKNAKNTGEAIGPNSPLFNPSNNSANAPEELTPNFPDSGTVMPENGEDVPTELKPNFPSDDVDMSAQGEIPELTPNFPSDDVDMTPKGNIPELKPNFPENEEEMKANGKAPREIKPNFPKEGQPSPKITNQYQ